MTSRSTSSSEGTTGESDHELRYISKYLVQVISTATPKSSSSAAKRVTGARVLTSAKCATILDLRLLSPRDVQEVVSATVVL